MRDLTVLGRVVERGHKGNESVRLCTAVNAARELGLNVNGDKGGAEWKISGIVIDDGRKAARVVHTVHTVDELEEFLAGYYAGRVNRGR